MGNVLDNLYGTILERKNSAKEADNSYTRYLFKEGLNKILKKIGEEMAETLIAAKDFDCGKGDREQVVGEVSDLIYQLTVMLASLDISFDEVEAELERRSEKMGNLKSQKIVDKNT